MKKDEGPAFKPADSEDATLEGSAALGDRWLPSSGAGLSKRAVRRLIQRTFVLVGRERHIRQHVRETRLTTLWAIEDWKLVWTVEFDRGKVHYERRPAKQPDMTLTWTTAEGFFRQIQARSLTEEGVELLGKAELRRFLEPVFRAFGKILSEVIQNPFDDEGTRLA